MSKRANLGSFKIKISVTPGTAQSIYVSTFLNSENNPCRKRYSFTITPKHREVE
jgi:hypothetical protein